jgi:hypothetical protein
VNLQENIQRIREMMGLLKEDNHYYDKILDMYSEFGMDGLTKDEQEYLKSGGQTELPKRFKSEIEQEKYDSFAKGEQSTELKSSDWEDIFDLQKIIDDSPNQVLVENNFDGTGFYLDVLCSLIFPKENEIIERLENLNNYSSELSEIKGKYYYYVIPKYYLEHLNGIKYKNLPPNSDRPEFEL